MPDSGAERIAVKMTLPSDQDASGRTLGTEELALLRLVVESGTLTSTKGAFVRQFEQKFAAMLGSRFGYACSSGTTAIHLAVQAIDPEPGDEIVTTAITDMGALAPILYQTAIPVFADVDPATGNVTAATIERVLSPRTRAIIVTHLFGCPVDMGPVMALAQARNIPVIEDCAQAFLATSGGRKVGTIGTIGCFSLQQGKHITTGEGGVIVTDDAALARRMYLAINKAWGYGDAKPDHYFVALNGRMTELQGAVALAQLDKLEGSVAQRRAMAVRLNGLLSGLAGLGLPAAGAGDEHVFWKYPLMVDPAVVPGGPVALGAALKEWSIASAPRYIQKPAFQCAVLRDQVTFGRSRFPFTLARPEAVDYSADRFPGTFLMLDEVLVLPWNEGYREEHVDYVASAIRDRYAALTGGAS